MPDKTDKKRSTSLEIEALEVRELANTIVSLALEWLAPSTETPVFTKTSATELKWLATSQLPRAGVDLNEIEKELRGIAAHSRLNNHARMFGYVASPSTAPGAFGALAAAALNINLTSWRSAPAGATVERTVIRWLSELIGFQDDGDIGARGGLLTSGGSMANLIALYVAHRAKARQLASQQAEPGLSVPDPSREGLWQAGAPMAVYASDQVHLSIPKAADILGFGRENVRSVPTDDGFVINIRELREMVKADRLRGLRPFCVVANAGTVSTGAVDPIDSLADIAKEQKLWLHVDGAYGVLAAMTKSQSSRFTRVERADSVALDPHKWLYTPVDCGCLLLREPEHAQNAFANTEEGYIKVFESEQEETFAFWDYGIELSRPFRALKVWMLLRYYGADRIAAAIEEDCALALEFGKRIAESEDFELLAPVTLGICCFRYLPRGAREQLESGHAGERKRIEAQLNDLNERVMLRVQRRGRAYISNADLRGRFALRASITNYKTTKRDLDITLTAIRDAARDEQNLNHDKD